MENTSFKRSLISRDQHTEGNADIHSRLAVLRELRELSTATHASPTWRSGPLFPPATRGQPKHMLHSTPAPAGAGAPGCGRFPPQCHPGTCGHGLTRWVRGTAGPQERVLHSSWRAGGTVRGCPAPWLPWSHIGLIQPAENEGTQAPGGQAGWHTELMRGWGVMMLFWTVADDLLRLKYNLRKPTSAFMQTTSKHASCVIQVLHESQRR